MKVDQPPNKPHLDQFIYKMTAIIGGFIFGYDMSILSPAMGYLKDNPGMKPWTDSWEDGIFSAFLGGAALGALLAGVIADYFGRRKAIMYGDVINTIGAIICCASFTKWLLCTGVIFLGLATDLNSSKRLHNYSASLGVCSHSVPLYISESCPSYLRGRFIVSFQLTITIGIMMAFAVAGIVSYIDPVYIGWRLLLGSAAVPSIIQWIGYHYHLPQTPRYAFVKEGVEECEKIFEKIYNKNEDWVRYEIRQSREAHIRGSINKALHKDLNVILRVFTTSHVRRALVIGCLLLAFQQFCGANTILYFTDTLVKSAGIKGIHESIWISIGPAAVNFFCTFIPMYQVEIKGRRMMLITSVIGVSLSLIFMAFSFLMMNKTAARVIQLNNSYVDPWTNSTVAEFDTCNDYANCDFCVTDERCGFCTRQGEETRLGYCLPVDQTDKEDKSRTGYCNGSLGSDNYHHVNLTVAKVAIDTKFEWDENFCHTDYAVLPIIISVIYMCCFAIGFAPLPWVLNSEFYPFWARATCIAFSTFTKWSMDLVVSFTYLRLSLVFNRYGLFFVYTGFTLVGLIFFIFMVPETMDISVANVELLFMTEQERRIYHIDIDKEPHKIHVLDDTIKRIKSFNEI